MKENFTNDKSSAPPFGFAFLQLIVNDSGQAIDYLFHDVSIGFQKMVGLSRDDMLGKKASEVFADIVRQFDWLEYFRGTLISKKVHEIIRYVEVLDRECHIIVVPSDEEYFTLIFREVEGDDKEDSHSYKRATINMLLEVLREQCAETEDHANRLQEYCYQMGHHLKLTPEEMEDLSLLAVLHDIGKLGVNPAILKKPGPLTSKEWVEMKRHPEIGWRIIKDFPSLGAIANYILCHHERWDGKGYPSGLKTENIPLHSRILAVADAFDAMTSDRVYRKRMELDKAIAELRNNAGKQFDPQVVNLFIRELC